MRTAYEVLRVEPGASAEAIHRSYRRLARQYHPEGSTPEPARMVELNAAFDALKTPERRRRYDAELRRSVESAAEREAATGSVGCSMPLGALGRRMAAARGATPLIDFGPYAGWRVSDVAIRDPDYLCWLWRHPNGRRFHEAIARCLGGEPVVRDSTAGVG